MLRGKCEEGGEGMEWRFRNRPELRRTALLALCAAAAASFAAHGFLFSNEFFSHDSVSYFTYGTGTPAFYTGIGRFLIPLYEQLKGDVAAPWLIGLLFTLWMAGTGLLAADLLEIRSRGGVALTCALLCANMSLTLTGATYVYCMDEYAFALLCAAGAVWLFARGRWRDAAAGVGALVVSLAVYQAYFTVAAALCFLVILRRTAAGETLARVVRDGVRYLALLAGSFLLYYGLWGAVCAVMDVEKRRVEESLLAGGGLGRILSLVKEANVDYVSGLFDGGGVLGWLMPAVHLLLLCELVFCLWALLRKPGLAVGNKALLAILVCLIPTAFNAVWVLMNGGATQLMTFAGELLYLLALACREPDRGRPLPHRAGIAALLCLVLWQHVVFANQVYMKKDLEKNAALVLAGQVIGRIEGTEGYVPGETPVAFAGRLDHNGYLNRGREAFRDLEGTVGLWSDTAATYNLGRYLTDYLNYPLRWDTETDFSQRQEVRAMPVFPAAGSAAVVDGTVVVKLSQW